MTDRPRRLFHIVPAASWQARPPGPWRPPSLASEGFCHLSFAEQLGGTLRTHDSGETAVVLLELDPARLGKALVLEPSRGGALFPHLYRAIDPADVLGVRTLHRAPGAPWDVPNEGSEERDA